MSVRTHSSEMAHHCEPDPMSPVTVPTIKGIAGGIGRFLPVHKFPLNPFGPIPLAPSGGRSEADLNPKVGQVEATVVVAGAVPSAVELTEAPLTE
jgi:hypothetical protein